MAAQERARPPTLQIRLREFCRTHWPVRRIRQDICRSLCARATPQRHRLPFRDLLHLTDFPGAPSAYAPTSLRHDGRAVVNAASEYLGVAIIFRPVDPFTRRKATPKSQSPEGSLGSCCVAAFIGNFFEQLAGFSEHGVLISNDF